VTALLRRDGVMLAVFVLLALAPLLLGPGHALGTLSRAEIFGVAALGVALLASGAGLVTFGHAATLGVGAYVAAWLDGRGIDDAAMVLPAAALGAALFALLTGAVALRTSGVQFIMITLAFGQMAFFVAGSLTAFGGDDGATLNGRLSLLGRGVRAGAGLHWLALAVLVAAWLGGSTLLASRSGRVLRAAKENALRVRALGYEPAAHRLIAYAVAGAMGGLAGALLVHDTGFVSPAYLTWQRSGDLLFMAILGGTGTIDGAVLGALGFVLLEEYLSALTEHWRVLFGPLLCWRCCSCAAGCSGCLLCCGVRRGPPRPRVPEPMLRVSGLRKRFGGLLVTDDVSIDVARGTIHGLIGPNGAGKTTLVNQIGGALRPEAGRVNLAGADVTHASMAQRARAGLGRCFQITCLAPGFTALENAALAAQARSGSSFRFFRPAARERALNEAAMAALETVGVAHRAEAKAAALSHGERRQLELAVAIAAEPLLLLLDEPLAGAGPEESERLIGLLGRLRDSYTILLVEHDVRAVFALADRITVLVQGRVLATDTPDAIRANASVRAAYLGEDTC